MSDEDNDRELHRLMNEWRSQRVASITRLRQGVKERIEAHQLYGVWRDITVLLYAYDYARETMKEVKNLLEEKDFGSLYNDPEEEDSHEEE